MDLKLLLSPVQKESEANSASTSQNNSYVEHATEGQPIWRHPSQQQQQQQPPQHQQGYEDQHRHHHPQYPHRPQQQQHRQPEREPYDPREPQQSFNPQHPQDQRAPLQGQPQYISHQGRLQAFEGPGAERPSVYAPQPDRHAYYDSASSSRGQPLGSDRSMGHPVDHGTSYRQEYRPSGVRTPPPRNPALVPPLLSVSASTPLTGESPQPPQYFVPTHKPTPAYAAPPAGLNLSSFGFMLMEKRDREREAMERANRTFLRGEASSALRESGPIADRPSRTSSPAQDDARRGQHAPYSTYEQQPFGHQGPPSSRDYSDYGHYPPATSHHHPSHYHSSGSTNIGTMDSFQSRPQEYGHDAQGSYLQHQPSHLQQQQGRAMSPSMADRPRFANANLSVFRQNAAEDSDGNASVSSSGSLKRRRRPNKTSDGKRSLLTGSALGGESGLYPMARTPSQGSYEGQAGFYDDDDSSDEQINVRNGLQGLNLQKSTKASVTSRAKKPRKKAERPFKIGELVESMKSDTDGTWFAGRVLDLEDDPHDHINPKSVLIHFEGFSPHHDEWVKPNQLRACSTGSSFLRYGPSGHEAAENWTAYEKFYHSDLGRVARRHTGLAYDRRMLLHKCQCNSNPEERHHPEQPERLVEILCQFQKLGMLSLVKWVQGREATIEELIAAHTDTHVRNYCCTAAENKRYARENNIDDPDLNTEDSVDEEPDEVEEAPTAQATVEDEEAGSKKVVRRGRPRKGTRGSILVPTTATSVDPLAETTPETAGAHASEDSEMTGPTSPTTFKEGMDIDLHSPALGRRRSSMRGSALRMSSLVSMSSTLYAQKEEDLLPEAIKASLAPEDEDDDDDKTNHAGPAPSEAAAAVAGGMDPAEASKLTGSPQMIPKFDSKDDIPVKNETSERTRPERRRLSAIDTQKAINDPVAKSEASPAGVRTGKDPISPKESSVVSPLRSSSRNISAEIVVPQKEKESPEKKAGNDKAEQAPKELVAAKTPIKKKGYKAVSPTPVPSSDAVAIRPPGLTFTMSCGQLGIAVDTTWSPYHSSTAAKVATGSLITLVDQVVTGRCKNGFAIIRPPGHHAEEDEAMGFCFFNNVGVAVNLTLQRYPLTVQKILIIDWDVHHGNGTQQIFYENPNVLYISLHRWDNGHFYPFTGAPDECGEEAGEGRNVNIAWSSYGRAQAMGDVEYIAAFWYVLLPIARQFQPDLVMVSAGFDAADGHASNIGGYTVSPQGFAILTRLVQTLAGGRVILSLEGGYEFEPLALSAAACLEELLPHSLLPATAPTRAFPFASFQGTLNSVKPNAMAVSSLHQVLKYQQKYWKFPAEVLNPSFRFQLPQEWKASNSLATRPRRERATRKKGGALD
ncbi:hypothetical protein EMPS_04545 [Entomortierella parvispora]|uniref:histone deacetylase n=1 Tax=Entomortierella parvispora TaxID=205924 RepID=A0A9P3LVK3_9FUNG|nr:hypothetical protein EMPS_04545 [Entomortierella parvispora]